MRDEIRTERLVLRQLTLKDAPVFARIAGNYDVAKMCATISYPFPVLSAEFKLMDKALKKQRQLSFSYAITLEGGEMIGIAEFFRPDVHSILEFGYHLDAAYWSKGYITEACRAMMVEAQKSLGASRIIAHVFHDNPASMHVLEKLGFEITGDDKAFSAARMETVKGFCFTCDLNQDVFIATPKQATPLRSDLKIVMSA